MLVNIGLGAFVTGYVGLLCFAVALSLGGLTP